MTPARRLRTAAAGPFEAGGSLIPEARVRAGAAPTRTRRVGTAKRSGLGKQGRKATRAVNQRMDVLGRANKVPALRAQLKPDLRAGRVPIGALLLDQPPYLETANVFDMLLALPKAGRVKATKILQSCRVSPSKTFGGLTERQRAELTGHLHRY